MSSCRPLARSLASVLSTLLLPAPWAILSPGFAHARPAIQQDHYGYRLPGPEALGLWWCESAWKVGRDRALPLRLRPSIRLDAARNEYESVQIILRPERSVTLRSIRVEPWQGVEGEASGAWADFPVRVCQVDYVYVLAASDSWGGPGWWPDPLLELAVPLPLAAGTHQPFLLTLYVPRETAPGRYVTAVVIETEEFEAVRVPVELEVYRFALPEYTHTPTAYYADVHVDSTWHRLSTLEQRRQTWDLYLQMYRQYRMAPYSPHLYAPITWHYAGGQLRVNFAEFDQAMSRYLDEFGFNAFNLFGHKSPPFPSVLEGYAAYGTNWWSRFVVLMDRIAHHLRLRGWMDRAYCYWADEPQGARFQEIVTGMDALRAGAPDLRRLLTFNVPPAEPWNSQLNGRVDIWTPMAHLAVVPRFLDRGQFGEENWWYVAVQPVAPYPNYFIDHPALAHRIRFWAQLRHGIRGDLYYAINMWMGRNPWEQTRTWSWSPANGDGVLVYPPTRTPPDGPVIRPPIPTLRLEMVRDGLEDLEYFELARHWIERATRELGPEAPAVWRLQEAFSNALALVTHVSQFSWDVEELLQRRLLLARALQAVDDGRLWWVCEPIDKAVAPGERCVLTAEALGWPPPEYQWYHQGHALEGARQRHLILESFSLPHEGEYFVVASQPDRAITSRVARLISTSPGAPRIVHHPGHRVVREGASVVFTVAAAPEEVMHYQWYRDGLPLPGPSAQRAALDLRDVTTADSGRYHVVVSNALGMATSHVATLIVKGPWARQTLIRTEDTWRMWWAPDPPPGNWTLPEYDDSTWTEVTTPVGSRSPEVRTWLDPRHTSSSPTVALRKNFYARWNLSAPLPMLHLNAAHGVRVYLNGHLIFATNAPPAGWGPAPEPMSPSGRSFAIEVPWAAVVDGWNTLAISLHVHVDPYAPVAWWSFDHPTGWWLDEQGVHDLQVHGQQLQTVPGVWGLAVTNSGSGSWLEAPDHPDLRFQGPLTVGGWFAYGWQTGDDPATLIIEKPGEFALFYTGTRTNRYGFRLGQTEVLDQTPGTRPGQWRFVLAWFDGSQACVQVDQGPVWCVPARPPEPGAAPVRLLHRPRPIGGFAADEIFFYRRVLSAEEAQRLYHAGPHAQPFHSQTGIWCHAELVAVVAQPPVITGATERLVRPAGQAAWLELGAVSAWPVHYQWLKDGSPLIGATQPLLRFPALTSHDTGWYRLVASNAGGAVTSAPVRVVAVAQPQLHWTRQPVASGWWLHLPSLPPEITAVLETSTNLTHWVQIHHWPGEEVPPSVSIQPPEGQDPVFYRLRLLW